VGHPVVVHRFHGVEVFVVVDIEGRAAEVGVGQLSSRADNIANAALEGFEWGMHTDAFGEVWVPVPVVVKRELQQNKNPQGSYKPPTDP